MNIKNLEKGFEVIDGNRVYTLEDKLGSGGQGVCYRADFHGDAKVVKLMQTTDDLVVRLRPRLLELNLALGTRYNVFNVDPITFAVVGDYYEGRNLRQVIDEKERIFSETETKEFLLQMCRRWLSPLYSRRLIHHDIKPENIILNDEAYSLIDFGGIKSLDSSSLSLSADGSNIKSFGYSRFWGEKSVQDDLYSVAKVVAFMLTGKDPEVLFTINEEIDRDANRKLVDSLKVNDRMKGVLMRMLSVERPYTAPEEIVMDLEERTSLVVGSGRTLEDIQSIIPTSAIERAKELKEYFRRNYAGFGPSIRPLSDEFVEEFVELLGIYGLKENSWGVIMKMESYFKHLGRIFNRNVGDSKGEIFFLLKASLDYFGFRISEFDLNDNVWRAEYDSYVPTRVQAKRGRGWLNKCTGLSSPYCWDERILGHVLSLRS